MYEDDSDHDVLHPWEIQAILVETLDDMDSLQGQDLDQDTIDEFEDTLEDEEINIIRMSHDPISSALHPLRHYNHLSDTTINEIQCSTTNVGHMDGGSMATTTDKRSCSSTLFR